MSSINNTEDFLRLLREDPDFKADVRRELLSQELIELPEKFAEFVTQTLQEISDIKARLERLEKTVAWLVETVTKLVETVSMLVERMDRVEGTVAMLVERMDRVEGTVERLEGTVERLDRTVGRLEGTVGRLEGSDYERHVSRTLTGEVSNLMHLRRGRIVHSAAFGTNPEFHDQMDAVVEADRITDSQLNELLNTDAILRATEEGRTVYAVAEISITVHEEDIIRADERAAILREGTGSMAYPVVIGDSIPQPQMAQADARNVRVINIQRRSQ